MAFTASTIERPPELYAIGPDGGASAHDLTERFARAPASPPRATAPSTDGVEVDVRVLTPPDFDPTSATRCC